MINNEEKPYHFAFVERSFQCSGHSARLSVSPTTGLITPHSKYMQPAPPLHTSSLIILSLPPPSHPHTPALPFSHSPRLHPLVSLSLDSLWRSPSLPQKSVTTTSTCVATCATSRLLCCSTSRQRATPLVLPSPTATQPD